MVEINFCSYCGEKWQAGSRYCVHCGRFLKRFRPVPDEQYNQFHVEMLELGHVDDFTESEK